MVRNVWLVYRLTDEWRPRTASLPDGISWTPATPSNLDCFFPEHDSSKRSFPLRILGGMFSKKKRFLRFLERGFVGVLLHERRCWTVHVWMSRPTTLGPPHLPRSIRSMHVFWLFYGRTHDAYRGRGLFKRALDLTIREAKKQDKDAEIYTDTLVNNVPARHVVRQTGFKAAGVLTTWRIPKTGLVWGNWNRTARHPSLET